MTQTRYARPGLLLAVLVSPAAFAHTGHETAGLLQGLAHPLSGLDHLLAMLAVGLWAAQAGGRATWLVPLSFLLAMAVGGALGMAGAPLPVVELGIAGSVLVFGLLVMSGARLPLAAGALLTGLLAVFHGHAHGTEMAAGGSALLYGLGFLAATAGLHGLGLAAGLLARREWSARLLRAGGAAISAAGLVLLGGVV